MACNFTRRAADPGEPPCSIGIFASRIPVSVAMDAPTKLQQGYLQQANLAHRGFLVLSIVVGELCGRFSPKRLFLRRPRVDEDAKPQRASRSRPLRSETSGCLLPAYPLLWYHNEMGSSDALGCHLPPRFPGGADARSAYGFGFARIRTLFCAGALLPGRFLWIPPLASYGLQNRGFLEVVWAFGYYFAQICFQTRPPRHLQRVISRGL